jgi:hypothetical protein
VRRKEGRKEGKKKKEGERRATHGKLLSNFFSLWPGFIYFGGLTDKMRSGETKAEKWKSCALVNGECGGGDQ